MSQRDLVEPHPLILSATAGAGNAPPLPSTEAARFQTLGDLHHGLSMVQSWADVLAALQSLLLPALADWWLLSVRDGDGPPSVHAAHADPDRAGLARIVSEYQPAGVAGGAWDKVLSTAPVLCAVADRDQVALLAWHDEQLALLQGLGMRSYMALPLRCRERQLGTLVLVCGDSPRRYGAADLGFAATVADRIALAIEQARLHERLEAAESVSLSRARSLDLLAEATEVLVETSLNVEETLSRVAHLLGAHVADAGAIRLIGESGQVLPQLGIWQATPEQERHIRALAATPSLVDDAFGGQVYRTGRPLVIADVSLADLLGRLPARCRKAMAALNPVSLMVVPLRGRQGIIGMITLLRTVGRPPFGRDDLVFAQDLADRAGRAIDHARLSEAAEVARQQAEAASLRLGNLQGVAAALSVAQTLQEVAGVILRAGCSVLQSAHGVVYDVSADRQTIRVLERLGDDEGQHQQWSALATDTASPIGDVIRQGQPLYMESLPAYRGRYPGLEAFSPSPGGAGAVLPLVANGETIGAIAFAFTGERPLPAADRMFLLALADHGAHALERVRLHERLSQGRQEMRALVDVLPVLVAFIDRDQRYRLVNQAYARHVGQPQEALRGRHVRTVLGERQYRAILPHVERALGGERVHDEASVPAFGLGLRWMATDFVPHLDGDGRVSGFAVLLQDLTDRKVMEDRLAQALEHERRARLEADQVKHQVSVVARFSDGLQATLDYEQTVQAIVRMGLPEIGDLCLFDALDADGRLKRVALAHGDGDAGLDIAEAQAWPPPLSMTEHPIVRAALSKEPFLCQNLDDTLLDTVALSAGHRVLLAKLNLQSLICIPVLLDDVVLGVLTFAFRRRSGRRHDETHVLLAQALAWRAANAMHKACLYRDAQAALRLRDDFLSVASHELRTPLTSLGLQLEIICRQIDRQQEDPLSVMIRPRLSQLHDDIDRLTRLVNELVDVTRLSSGQLSLACGEVAIPNLLDEVVARFAPRLERSGSAVTVTTSGRIVGHWDRFRLDQVLAHLLANAVTYGAGRPITVRAVEVAGWAEITVSDQGIGISPADQERLFQRFERFAPIDHRGGFGLGLWTVRRLVEAMGGTVSLVSALGQGTTFTVRLPLCHADG